MNIGIRSMAGKVKRVVALVYWPIKSRLINAALASLIIVGSVCVVVYLRATSSGQQFTGSHECIKLVKQIEGTNFHNIKTLTCTLGTRTIGNSNLGAKQYSYEGELKDPEGCASPIDPGMTPTLQVCPNGTGIVLSNGKRYEGLSDRQNNDDRPFDYDECYAGTGIDMLAPPVPTTTDLYFYKDNLYYRHIYTNIPVKTPVGTCVVNGTTLINDSLDGAVSQITNVVVSYPGFPKDCSGLPIGANGDDFYKCVSLVTAARADLSVCHSGFDIDLTRDYRIKNFKQGAPAKVGQWCEDAYIQRMAALQKCDLIENPTNRDTCKPLVDHPYVNTTRIFGKI